MDGNRAALAIFRHAIEQADAVGALCDAATAEAAVPNVRSLFEAWMYLQFLFEDRALYRKKSLAWLVTHAGTRTGTRPTK